MTAITPDEAQALGAAGPLPAAGGSPRGEAMPYDLASRDRAVRAGLPGLDMVHERFARDVRAGLASYLRRGAAVAAGTLVVQPYAGFIRTLPLPATLHLVQLRPLRGTALFACDAALVTGAVDALFGGPGRGAPAEGREFSPTERRIGTRLADILLAEYARSWSQLQPLEVVPQRLETHPQFAGIVAPQDLVATARFAIDLGGGAEGGLHVCLPYDMLEPVRERLAGPAPVGADEPDRRWVAALSQQIKSATVELAAELAHGDATVGELLALKAGDFIALDRRATLTAKVDGVPVFECDYGTVGPHYGLRIREFLTQAVPAAAPARS